MNLGGSILASLRRALTALVASFYVIAMVSPAQAALGPPRYAAILIDARTGEVLYANAADELRHPASITKIMTLYLAFDALVAGRLRLNDPITISRHAASQRPSRLGLAVGKSLTLDDAIHVITVKSANDVAVALGERLGGTETAFAELMTRKARLLGMSNTTFTNASGLPEPGNVTTARDIATLSAALLRNHPSYYAYFGQQEFSFDKHRFTNHNHLLGKMSGLDGIKTGYTVDSGYTLAASALRDGRRLITVVLGEPSIAARNRDVTALLDAGFSVLDRRRYGEETTVAANLPNLNHPALRVAAVGEQGSRNEPSAIRRWVPPSGIFDKPVERSAAHHKKTDRKLAAKADKKATKANKADKKLAAKAKKTGERSAVRSEKGKGKSKEKLASAKAGKSKAKGKREAEATTTKRKRNTSANAGRLSGGALQAA